MNRTHVNNLIVGVILIPIGVAFALGRSNSLKPFVWGSKRPILEAPLAQNHRQRSLPSTQI